MIVLFLDIDDVITTSWSFRQSRSKKNWFNGTTYPFDPKCVNILNEALKLTPTNIVLTSDWRSHFSLPEIQEIFLWNKVSHIPTEYTPFIFHKKLDSGKLELFEDMAEKRDTEITKYINDNNIENFYILDDMPLKCYPERFIRCKIDEGLKQCGMLGKITKLLKKLENLE